MFVLGPSFGALPPIKYEYEVIMKRNIYVYVIITIFVHRVGELGEWGGKLGSAMAYLAILALDPGPLSLVFTTPTRHCENGGKAVHTL